MVRQDPGDDLEAAPAAMARTEVDAHRQGEMAEFFTGLRGRGPEEGFPLLTEVFHLEGK